MKPKKLLSTIDKMGDGNLSPDPQHGSQSIENMLDQAAQVFLESLHAGYPLSGNSLVRSATSPNTILDTPNESTPKIPAFFIPQRETLQH